MIHKTKFFDNLEKLIAENGVFIERKSGTCHPKYPDFVYIVDYGYIRGTQSQDGNEIDIFVGTCNNGVIGCLVTLDLYKKDSEIKVLFNCNDDEISKICLMMNHPPMSCALLRK